MTSSIANVITDITNTVSSDVTSASIALWFEGDNVTSSTGSLASNESGVCVSGSYSTWQIAGLGLLAGLTTVATIAGNLIVLLSFFIDRTIRGQPNNCFIASLASSDLLIGCLSMPFYTVYMLAGKSWPLGELMCDLWLSIDYTVCLCSIYTVFCITIDRFCSISIPAAYRNWRTQSRIATVVTLTWIVPALIFFTTIFGWQYFVGERTVPPGECYVQYMENPVFNCLLQIGYFWITLIVMCVLYFRIYHVALNLHRKSKAKHRKSETALFQPGGACAPDRMQKRFTVRRSGSESQQIKSLTTTRTTSMLLTPDTAEFPVSTFYDDDVTSWEPYAPSSMMGTGFVLAERNRVFGHDDEKLSQITSSLDKNNSDGLVEDYNSVPVSAAPPEIEPPIETPNGGTALPMVDALEPRISLRLQITSLRGQRRKSSGESTHPSPSSELQSPNLDKGCQRDADELILKSISQSPTAVDHPKFLAISKFPDPGHSTRERGMGVDIPDTSATEYGLPYDDVQLAGEDTIDRVIDSPVWKRRSWIVPDDSSRIVPQNQPMLFQGNSPSYEETPNNPLSSSFQQVNQLPGKTPSQTTKEKANTTDHELARDDVPTARTARNLELGILAGTGPEASSFTVSGSSEKHSRCLELETSKNCRCITIIPSHLEYYSGQRDNPTPSSIANDSRRRQSKAPAEPKNKKRVSIIKAQFNAGRSFSLSSTAKSENRAKKALRTITIILGAFIVCWTPWHILSLVIGFVPTPCSFLALYDVSYWFCYLNSPINPFCYAFASQHFKKTFVRILKLDWHRT